jgi:hypothetical protein
MPFVRPRSHPLWAAVAARNSGHRRVTLLTWAAAVASVLGTVTVAEVARAATTSSTQPPEATTVVPLHLHSYYPRIRTFSKPTPTHTAAGLPTPRATHRAPSASPSPSSSPSQVLTPPTTPPAPPTTPPVVISSGS